MSEKTILAALKELVAADDAMCAFLLTADADEIGEEAWAAQHKERATRKRAATLAAIAEIKAAEAQPLDCTHCGKPTNTVACGIGGCPLGADL